MNYKNKSDDELVGEPTLNVNTRASNEMMRRLKDSTDYSSRVMIVLTIILIILTGILIWQGFK